MIYIYDCVKPESQIIKILKWYFKTSLYHLADTLLFWMWYSSHRFTVHLFITIEVVVMLLHWACFILMGPKYQEMGVSIRDIIERLKISDIPGNVFNLFFMSVERSITIVESYLYSRTEGSVLWNFLPLLSAIAGVRFYLIQHTLEKNTIKSKSS